MTRLAMDGVDLFFVEHGCAANIKVISCLCIVKLPYFCTERFIFLFCVCFSLDGYCSYSELQPAQPGSGGGHQRRGAGRKHPAVY